MRQLNLMGIAGFILTAFTLPVRADPPVIENAELSGNSLYVTISHPDSGWDHYADLWQVFDANGTLIGERVLLHPHVNEQPFTRSLRLDTVPLGETLTIIASCTDGDTSKPFELAQPE